MSRNSAGDRGRMMLQEPISRVIPRLAVPTMISMLITSVYNLADTFFVSQLGTSASGAVGVVFSAMMIIQAFAFMIGIGSGTNMSRALGGGRRTEAEHYVAICFFTEVILGTLIGSIGLIFSRSMVRFLGATETIAPYAEDYARYIFFATPFMMASFGLNNLMRFQGMAMYSAVGISLGGLLNIMLDPILIFDEIHIFGLTLPAMGLGTAGAAVATAVSQMTSFLLLLIINQSNRQVISIRLRNFRPTLERYGHIVNNGLPSLGRQGIASVSTILLNNTAGVYGDAAIAAMSIVSRCVMFINSFTVGFGQGFQPVCSFCYGAGKYKRVREAFFFCMKVATIGLTLIAVVAFCFSGELIAVFRRDDPEVIAIGTLALQMQLALVPAWGFITLSNMLTQSIGYGFRATIVAISRQGLCLIPILLICPRLFGLLGIQMAQPLSDFCTIFVAYIIVRSVLKQLKSMPDTPDEPEEHQAEA